MAYAGHALVGNRSGLVRLATATRASGTAEREAALGSVDRLRGGCRRRLTLGADKSHGARGFAAGLRARRATPHVAQDGHPTRTGRRRRPSTDARTTRHPGYAPSRRARKRVEEVFGWLKTVATLRRTRHRGLPRVAWSFTLAAAACNLVRLPRRLRPAA